MLKPKLILENEMYKILLDFEIHMDQILARIDLMIICKNRKKTLAV